MMIYEQTDRKVTVSECVYLVINANDSNVESTFPSLEEAMDYAKLHAAESASPATYYLVQAAAKVTSR